MKTLSLTRQAVVNRFLASTKNGYVSAITFRLSRQTVTVASEDRRGLVDMSPILGVYKSHS